MTLSSLLDKVRVGETGDWLVVVGDEWETGSDPCSRVVLVCCAQGMRTGIYSCCAYIHVLII